GYSLGQADLLRRAMGKKDREKMARERKNFIRGCAQANKIPEKKANAIFDLLEKFAGYGFNKSHSAAYGIISYQTAYLKAKWPVEYMAAGMSVAMGDTDKLASYIGLGLGAVKGAGEKAIQSVVDARSKGGRFGSIYEFCERLDSKHVDKKVVE